MHNFFWDTLGVKQSLCTIFSGTPCMKCEMVCFVGQKSMKIIRTLNCCSDQGCDSSHQFCLCQSCNFPGWKSGHPHHQLHDDQLPIDDYDCYHFCPILIMISQLSILGGNQVVNFMMIKYLLITMYDRCQF